jgi:hypothetical protein
MTPSASSHRTFVIAEALLPSFVLLDLQAQGEGKPALQDLGGVAQPSWGARLVKPVKLPSL